MEQANQPAGICDCLLVPNHFFLVTVSIVFRLVLVFLAAELLVCIAHWEDEEESMCRSGNESEQLWLINAEDIMECELLREAKLVNQSRHDLGVVLCETCWQ